MVMAVSAGDYVERPQRQQISRLEGAAAATGEDPLEVTLTVALRIVAGAVTDLAGATHLGLRVLLRMICGDECCQLRLGADLLDEQDLIERDRHPLRAVPVDLAPADELIARRWPSLRVAAHVVDI
jgi:hypothetical protein